MPTSLHRRTCTLCRGGQGLPDTLPVSRMLHVSRMLLAPRMFHVAWLALLFALPGCAGYQWGTDTLYPPDVRTVYVPMIESTSFRRNQGERLTEAVIKEIERVTPFKVVNSPDADSVLTATLISETKRITIESPTDEGRQLEVNYSLQVMWADRKGDLIQQEIIASEPEMAVLTHTGSFTPEVGQSLATAQQEAIRRIARQVVGLMEVPW